MTKIGVVGAGSWGTTLANVLAKKGNDVTLWVYEPELAARLPETRVNDLYLEGVTLSPNLSYSNSLPESVRGCQVVLLVSPSQVIPQALAQLKPPLPDVCLLVSPTTVIPN